MSGWKVILATLVIFLTGFFAGVLFPRTAISSAPRNAPPLSLVPPPPPIERRLELLRRLTRELSLSDDQRTKINAKIEESQERTKLLWDLVTPELQEEFRRLRNEVVEELSPEQRKQFEERSRRYRRERGQRSDTNAPLPSVDRPKPNA